MGSSTTGNLGFPVDVYHRIIVDSVRQVCSSLHVRNAFPDELINRSTLHGGHGPETSGACK